jgi:hypothetical protein
MNVMLVSVTQRTAAGAVLGYLLGQSGAALIRQIYPAFPAFPAGLGGARRARHGAGHRHPVRRAAGAPGRAARPRAGAVPKR